MSDEGGGKLPLHGTSGGPEPEPDVGAQPPGTLAAPDLRGMTARDARQVARLSDLRVWADSRTVNEAMWERVVAQDPVPGASLSPGDAITITIGARPEVVVPDLRGRDEDEMVTAIRGLGLLPGRRVVRRSGAVPEGHIVRTRPRAGTTVPPGSRIAFVVAVAPEPHHKLDRHRAKRRPPRGLPPDAFISLPAKE